jgi:hypothetical protein
MGAVKIIFADGGDRLMDNSQFPKSIDQSKEFPYILFFSQRYTNLWTRLTHFAPCPEYFGRFCADLACAKSLNCISPDGVIHHSCLEPIRKVVIRFFG